MDWVSGSCKAVSSFQVDEAWKEYKRVLKFLKNMKAGSRKTYHRVMHQVFCNVG